MLARYVFKALGKYSMTNKKILSPISEILEDLQKGKLVVIVDDENRENEGDLVLLLKR